MLHVVVLMELANLKPTIKRKQNYSLWLKTLQRKISWRKAELRCWEHQATGALQIVWGIFYDSQHKCLMTCMLKKTHTFIFYKDTCTNVCICLYAWEYVYECYVLYVYACVVFTNVIYLSVCAFTKSSLMWHWRRQLSLLREHRAEGTKVKDAPMPPQCSSS